MATIQGVYIALFGRPADPTGLAYFNGVTKNGADLSAIGNLAGQKEYTDRFAGLNNVAIINSIYQSLFGRDAETAGLTFFSNALATGTLTINNIAIAILDGAQGDDKTIVANKLVAAGQFTAALDTSIEIQSYVGNSAAADGRAFLAPVGKDVATIPTAAATDTAVAGVVAHGQAGVTLASAADAAVTYAPTGQDTAHTTTDRNDSVTLTGYTALAKVDGGLGTDTLDVAVAAVITPAAGFITNVEKIFVESTANGGLNLTNVTGVTEVYNDTTGAFTSTISGMATTVAVGLEGAIGGATTFTYNSVAGTADAATLILDNATSASAVNVAGIETLTVNVKSASTVSNLIDADAKTVTVTGAGDLSLTAHTAAVTTIDASAHTGKFILSGIIDDTTVKGGTGNDTFNVGADAEGVKLTGGAGSDLFHFGALTNIDLLPNADILKDVNIVTDFDSTTDTLQIDGLGTKATLTNVQSTGIAGAATIADALVFAAQATATNATDGYVTFAFKGDTYVYHDVGHDGLTAGDGLVQITGFTGTLTDANFVHA